VAETRSYNTAGIEAREYYVANEDPCGYMEENPNIFHAAINTAVGDAIQRVIEIKENNPELFAMAARKYNLAREMAARAATEPTQLELWSLRIRKVVDSIG
jgi:hypothetical protein